MNIYDEDAETGEKTLNPDRARMELRNTSGSSLAETVVRRGQNEIQIATLLDIAESLRILAFEAASSMNGTTTNYFGSAESGADDDTDPDEAGRDFLVIGDLVHAIGSDIIAEVVGLGVDQDEVYALVEYEGVTAKEWKRNLVRLRGDERPGPDPKAEVDLDEHAAAGWVEIVESETPLQGVATPAEAVTLRTDADEDGEEAVGGYELAEGMTDELDDDFAGDDHSDTESAIERLRKLEKPAKKKTAAKKGKKA